jgi:Amt family ammonium transporter
VSPTLGGPSVVSDWVTGKTEYPGYMAQLIIQAKAVGMTIVWSGVVAYVSYKIVDLTIGLRVPEEQEREGLDITSHGESAYRTRKDLPAPLRAGGFSPPPHVERGSTSSP